LTFFRHTFRTPQKKKVETKKDALKKKAGIIVGKYCTVIKGLSADCAIEKKNSTSWGKQTEKKIKGLVTRMKQKKRI
jgi:hypothetical protein